MQGRRKNKAMPAQWPGDGRGMSCVKPDSRTAFRRWGEAEAAARGRAEVGRARWHGPVDCDAAVGEQQGHLLALSNDKSEVQVQQIDVLCHRQFVYRGLSACIDRLYHLQIFQDCG